MSVFQGSDLTSWYNRLNAVRQKQNINLGAVTEQIGVNIDAIHVEYLKKVIE